MKNKIIGIFVCMLLIATSVTIVESLQSSNMNSTDDQDVEILEWNICSPPIPKNTSSSIVDAYHFLLSNSKNNVLLSNVPTSTWTYGCTATAAGMLFGYYDRIGYSNMYTGPANGGVCPLIDLGQGIPGDGRYPISGSCYIIATEMGLDGITYKAHANDYWISYNSPGPDPWENNWLEHSWSLCVADFLGTNQWKWDRDLNGIKDCMADGSTRYFYYSNGTKLYDYIPPAAQGLPQTACCHGCRLFAESRGYSVVTNYNQLTNTPNGNPSGFTFSEFKGEINAGRPVLTHWSSPSAGHTMLGVGYNSSTNTIYFHDTWDNSVHQCNWNGTYSGYNLELRAVTVLQLAPKNDPPLLGTPSPVNGSTGNLLSFSWNIPINDPEGNTFTWTIQCSNGQVSSGTGASNGTKSLALSGLTYSKTYKVWVNATDPTPNGSDRYTRRWYAFTTKANLPPVFGTPSPANGSTNQLLSLTWSIPINDLEGNTFTWTIQCNNGQTNSGTGATNGTKSVLLSGLAYSKTYKIWVNATDPTGSGLYTRKWYQFMTKENLPPLFGTSIPTNNSTSNPLSLTWSIPINDPEGNTFSWTIQCNNGQTNSGTSTTNGTKTLTLSGLVYATTYKVWVNATDPTGSGLYTRRWYTFTTKGSNPPVFGTPSLANGSTGNLLSFSWSISINDPEGDLFSWTIQCNNSQTNSATGATNGTKTLALSGLAYATSYKIWVNATDPTGSGLYTRRWYIFTTIANQPPSTPTITGPAQGKINVATEYNFIATDPDGENVYYFIDWGDGTNSSWIGPYSSGNIVTKSHTWSTKGTYTIKAKAKDILGNESSWGTLSITMPYSYNIPFLSFWERLFERFPNAFPILRHLMGY